MTDLRAQLQPTEMRPAKSLRAIRAVVELWKNADPDLQPKVAEVRQRLARLKDFEKK